MMNIVDRENIRLKVNADSWDKAIREAGTLLVNSGKIKDGYIEHMIESVTTFGPYMVIIPHVAIAHARPDENVLEEGVSLITLEKPVEFGNRDNDPVDIIIAFAARSNTGHLETITKLSRFLENEQHLNDIRNSRDIDGVFRLINQTMI
jgi:PTS system ascorbate-specific IIA component